MRASRAKLDHVPSIRGHYDTRGLARDKSLKVDSREQEGLENLRFDDGSGYAQQRLHGEDHGSFRNCPDISSESEVSEVVEEAFADMAECRVRSNIGDLFFFELQRRDPFERLFE